MRACCSQASASLRSMTTVVLRRSEDTSRRCRTRANSAGSPTLRPNTRATRHVYVRAVRPGDRAVCTIGGHWDTGRNTVSCNFAAISLQYLRCIVIGLGAGTCRSRGRSPCVVGPRGRDADAGRAGRGEGLRKACRRVRARPQQNCTTAPTPHRRVGSPEREDERHAIRRVCRPASSHRLQ